MQNSMEIGTTNQHFGARVKDKKTNKRQEKIQEKLRKLQEVMPSSGECGGDPLRLAVQHLQATREKRRQLNAYHQQGGQQWATPHHTNYTAGYTDSVRDVNRMMVNNPTLSNNVRANIAQFVSHKQEYNRRSPGGGMSQLGFEGSPVQTNPNLRYNFYYPPTNSSSSPQIQHAPSTPYTYWKPW